MTDFLVKRFIKNSTDVNDPAVRTAYGNLAGAVGTAREWVKELVRSISPELSIHDFRMVQGPSHTNLIFDTVVPHNFPLSDAALRKRIQSLVETHDAGETKYYAVVTIDHSYAAIPGACKTDGKE